mgnify:CR=1 FL=1
MEKKIEDALIAMGIPASISGFDFIKDAVLILDRDGMKVKWTGVYAEIGNKCGKSASKVERAIRHAFEVARSVRGDYDSMNHYIGFSNTNNASSICLLYRTIKREMEEEQADQCVKCTDEQPVISEQRVKEIVRETIKEILGGIV